MSIRRSIFHSTCITLCYDVGAICGGIDRFCHVVQLLVSSRAWRYVRLVFSKFLYIGEEMSRR